MVAAALVALAVACGGGDRTSYRVTDLEDESVNQCEAEGGEVRMHQIESWGDERYYLPYCDLPPLDNRQSSTIPPEDYPVDLGGYPVSCRIESPYGLQLNLAGFRL